jgi:LPS O-antigen subunit length determinant protein (WzzB/FepE family)
MTKNRSKFDDDIDFFEYFEAIIDAKWKIVTITFFAVLVGVSFTLVKANSFKVSIPILPPGQSEMLKFKSVTELIREKGMYFNEELNPLGYKLDSETIFDDFIFEFNDYDEMIEVLSKNDYVNQTVKDLDMVEKQRTLTHLASQFKLTPPYKKVKNWRLQFEWHDDYEGRSLLNDAIQLTLINVRSNVKNDLNELAKARELENSIKLDTKRRELATMTKSQLNKDKKRMNFLIAQSAIAKEIGIAENTNYVHGNGRATQKQLTSLRNISLNFRRNQKMYAPYYLTENFAYGNPYYLRGYKVIDKELQLMKGRSPDELLVNADGNIDIMDRIIKIENDVTPSQLIESAKYIEAKSPKDWVEYNLEVAGSVPQKKPLLYIALSILIGGMLSIIYVLISYTIRKRKGIA